MIRNINPEPLIPRESHYERCLTDIIRSVMNDMLAAQSRVAKLEDKIREQELLIWMLEQRLNSETRHEAKAGCQE